MNKCKSSWAKGSCDFIFEQLFCITNLDASNHLVHVLHVERGVSGRVIVESLELFQLPC